MAEIGLRFWNGSAVVEIPVLADLTDQPLRIAKAGTTYAISLVDTSSPDALPIRIQTPAGLKALGYTAPVVVPTVKVNSISFVVNDVFREWDEVYATINIIDAVTLLPLSGVVVTAVWSGAYSATVTGVTDGSGNKTFLTPWISSGLVTMTVTEVKIGGVLQPLTGTLTNSVYVS